MPTRDRLGRALGAGVATVAALNLISGISRPIEPRESTARLALAAAILVAHAGIYWIGADLRARRGVGVYLAVQGTLLFIFGLISRTLPLNIVVFGALTAQAIQLARPAYSAMTVTLASIAVFCVATVISTGIYYATTVALILAAIGIIVRAVVPIARDAAPAPVAAPLDPVDTTLTARELEVLRLAASGTRSRDIATRLAISERTVKAHLAAVYRKLGVETRTAAATVAAQRGLL